MYYLFASFIISLCIVPIESLACFSYISMVALVAIVASILAITLENVNSYGGERSKSAILFDINGFPAFVGISLFTMEGIGMVFPIRSSMSEISGYPKLYRNMMIVVFFVCGIFAVISYAVCLV